MTAHTRLDPPLVESIRKALTGNALPGETQGLSGDAERDAAEFLAAIAATRKRGELALAIESTGGEAGNRRMRIGMVNEVVPHDQLMGSVYALAHRMALVPEPALRLNKAITMQGIQAAGLHSAR